MNLRLAKIGDAGINAGLIATLSGLLAGDGPTIIAGIAACVLGAAIIVGAIA